MTLENFSYIISIILLVSSIISPIATAFINNRYKLKEKQMELYDINKQNALLEFINSAQAVIYEPLIEENILQYQISFNSLFAYFSFDLSLIKKFEQYRIELVKNKNPETYKQANRELTNIVQALSKQIMKK